MTIKFGVFLGAAQGAPGETTDYDTIRKITLECETLGFDSCWLADHFVPRKVLPYSKSPTPSSDPFYECWTTLTALAVETEKIRIGTFVLCNSYRYPSLVAKMSATLDVISRGRLELGLGAGFFKEEYIMYGIPFPKLNVRIGQLEESIQIIKKMWTEEEASFNGKYYTIQKAVNNPKPIQHPHPPIWIGGRSKHILRVAAKWANVWNFPPALIITPTKFKKIVEILNSYCSAFERDPNCVGKSLGIVCLIARSKKELYEKIQRYKYEEETIGEFSRRLVGTPEDCIEKINRFIDAGVTYFILHFPDIKNLECLKLFAKEVIPAVKENLN